MTSNGPPEIALCPRCFCPLNVGQIYPVNLCLPARVPAPTNHPGQPPASRAATDPSPPPATGAATHPLAPPVYQQNDGPVPTPEPSTNTQPLGHKEDRAACAERRVSGSSSSSFDSVFSDLPNNAEFAASLQAVEEKYFSQESSQERSSPPPPISSSPPGFSLTLSAIPSSSPSTESSLTLSGSDEPLSTARRWVVFYGRVPGVYTSS